MSTQLTIMQKRPLKRKQYNLRSANIVNMNDDESYNSKSSKRKRTNSGCQHSSKEPDVDVTKKQILNTSSNSESNNGNVIQNVKSFADLPPETIDAILNNVASTDLLNCRRVNWQWNEISSRIIRNRDDTTVQFELINGEFIQKIRQRDCEKMLLMDRTETSTLRTKTLSELVGCVQDSKHFPFTNYRFHAKSDLESRIMQDFFPIFGSEIRSLKVKLRHSESCIEILREILCETPNLKKLKIILWEPDVTASSCNVGLLAGSHPWRLPKLEDLVVDNYPQTLLPKITEDILTISPNLKVFSNGGNAITAQDLQMLQSTKKLHCLKDVTIVITEDLVEYWKKAPQLLKLQLESLNLGFCPLIFDIHQLKLEATKMLNELLHSNKDVIQSFSATSLLAELLAGVVFPKFEKLETLSLYERPLHNFPAFDWIRTFPSVKQLVIARLGNSIHPLFGQPFHLPNIESLQIWCGTRHVFRELLKMTPNVKSLVVVEDYNLVSDPIPISPVNFEEISTYMPKLENFGWQFQRPDYHRMHKLDALITGLPENLCKELAGTFRYKDHLSAEEVSSYQQRRIHSSILDLKELRRIELDIFCSDEDIGYSSIGDEDSGWKDLAGPDTRLSDTGFTKVSKLLAFDLIPNLKVFTRTNFEE